MFSKYKFAIIFLTVSLVLVQALILFPANITVQAKGASSGSVPDFDQFVKSIGTGKEGEILGVYVPGLFASNVLQQPSNNPAYVSPVNNVVTEFSAPKSYGSIGLLAHNYLSGAKFSKLAIGQEIKIVYGDGKVESYIVKEILQYQALKPESEYSRLVDLNTGQSVSASKVFKRAYTGKHHLTLQTCIYAKGEMKWGRLFVIAVPTYK